MSKTIDLVIAHDAVGQVAPEIPSLQYINELCQLTYEYVDKVLCKQLAYKLHCALKNTGIKLTVRTEQYSTPESIGSSTNLYVYYPCSYGSLYDGYTSGVVKVCCSPLFAAINPI